jgi:hypothetical protein
VAGACTLNLPYDLASILLSSGSWNSANGNQ